MANITAPSAASSGSSLTAAGYGLLAAMIPSFVMLCTSISIILYLSYKAKKSATPEVNEKINPVVRASALNFSAGILLAAIGSELFPLLSGNTWSSFGGLIIGTLFGIYGLYGLERLVDKLDDCFKEKEADGTEKGESDTEPDEAANETPAQTKTENFDDDTSPSMDSSQYNFDLTLSSMQSQNMQLDIESVSQKALEIADLAQQSQAPLDVIDQNVHDLQFLLDKTRRTLYNHPHQHLDRHQLRNFNKLIRLMLSKTARLQTMLQSSGADDRSAHKIRILHKEINQLERIVFGLEAVYEIWQAPYVFHRWAVPKQPPPKVQLSERLPAAYIAAVCIDGLIDGFLIGLTMNASLNAGVVMAGATCLEMGFLGMSFTATLSTRTRDPWRMFRISCLPVLLMSFGGFLGGFIARAVQQLFPTLFTAMVAFAVVALLFLTTQELIPEAREVQDQAGSEPVWYVQLWLFWGVLVVLVLDKLVS